MQADGQVLIDTKINTDGAEVGYDDIIASARRMAKTVDGLSNSVKSSMAKQADALEKAGRAYTDQEQKVEALRQKLEELKAQDVPTSEYSELEATIAKSEKELDRLIEKQIRFTETGGNVKSRTFEQMEYDIENVRQKLEELRAKKAEMEAGKTAFISGGATQEAADLTEQLVREEQKLDEMHQRLITSTEQLGGKIEELSEKIRKEGEEAEKAGETEIAVNEKVKESRESKNAGLGVSLKTMLKYGLGIRSLYMLVNKLRSALVDGFKNLAQYSSGTNQALSGLMSSLTQCKNALATAFDPILQAVAPALNYLISLVTQAATAVAQLMSVLTGKGTYTKAVKVQQDYAKSLKGTGSAAKEAGEDAEGALAPFDKLNVMADQATGTSGGGGGADTSAADMFETVSVDNNLTKAIDAVKAKLKELQNLFKQGFWQGLGDTSVFDSIKNSIAGIKQSLAEIFTDPAVTEAANNFVNTFVYALGEITGSVASIGLTIADNLLGGFNMFLEQNKERLKEQIVSVFDIAADISQLVGDWFVTIADLFTVFRSDEAKGITADIIAIFSDAFFGVTELVGKFVTDVLDTFLEPIRRNEEGIKTILNEIIGSVKNFTGELSGLVRDVLDGLNQFYDEHREEIKLVLEMIAETIYNTITMIVSIAQGMVDSLTEIVKAIRGVLDGLVDFVSGTLSGDWKRAWEGLKGIVKSIANGIIGVIESMVNGIVKGLNRISFDIPDWSPIAAGEHFGFDIQEISLPRLASGTVVPPRAGEFAAILGDNKRETEVVSPLSTIEQALENVMSRMQTGAQEINLSVNLDGRQIYKSVVDMNRSNTKMTGRNALAT